MHQSRARKSQKTSRWKKKKGTCTPYHGSGATRGVLGYTLQHLAWANRPARQTGAYPTELVWVWVMLCYGEGDAAYRNFTWRLNSLRRIFRSPSPFRSSENPTLPLSSLATFCFLLQRKGRCKRLTWWMERRKKKVSLNLFTFSVPSLSYLTSELSYFVCFYHILTSSVIYYWADPGQHGIYLFGRKVAGFWGVKSNMKDFSFHWH